MKKVKFSIVEKRWIRSAFVLGLVQILILCFFTRLFSLAQPVGAHDVKQIDIIVEDIIYRRISSKTDLKLVIIADSEKYMYDTQTVFDEYSVRDLYESICVGDKLSLVCKKRHTIYGRVNTIIAIRSETETYRTVEEYNSRQQGVPLFVVVIFSIIELFFVGIVIVYVWINYRTIKDLCKKTKKRRKKQLKCSKTEDSSLS